MNINREAPPINVVMRAHTDRLFVTDYTSDEQARRTFSAVESYRATMGTKKAKKSAKLQMIDR